MTSRESNESNAVEVDGIEFKTVMPERILQIPPNRPAAKTQVQFGIGITNNTANPRRFLLFSLLPDFLEINRKKSHVTDQMPIDLSKNCQSLSNIGFGLPALSGAGSPKPTFKSGFGSVAVKL